MYYPYFISYMLFGLFVSLVVFAWALKNNQFRDQQRARFLPILEIPRQRPAPTKLASRLEMIALFGLVCITLCASFSFVIFAIVKAG